MPEIPDEIEVKWAAVAVGLVSGLNSSPVLRFWPKSGFFTTCFAIGELGSGKAGLPYRFQ